MSILNKSGEFDNYLSFRFEKGNRGGIDMYLREFELNYSGFLPADKGTGILDIGCGMGHFIRFLKVKGYTNVKGVDVSREAVDYCKENKIEGVSLIDDLEDFLVKSANGYDAIILKSVIAHFKREDTISNLRLIRGALKDGGSLLVETFNVSVFSGLFAMCDDFTHKAGFTEESLLQVLKEAGFSNIKITGNRYRPKSIRGLAWVIFNKLWSLVLRMIYIAERGIGDNPKILSKLLIAAARK